jgi:hypothetical protein
LPLQSKIPMPLHLATHDTEGNPLTIKRKPGRPRKVTPAPSANEMEWAAQVNTIREQYVNNDDLVQSLQNQTPSAELLIKVIEELAIESAAIRYEIQSAHVASRSERIPQMISGRTSAILKMAAIIFEMAKLGLIELDLSSTPVQRVFEFFMETISSIATQTLPEAEAFIHRCHEALENWEDRV